MDNSRVDKILAIFVGGGLILAYLATVAAIVLGLQLGEVKRDLEEYKILVEELMKKERSYTLRVIPKADGTFSVEEVELEED